MKLNSLQIKEVYLLVKHVEACVDFLQKPSFGEYCLQYLLSKNLSSTKYPTQYSEAKRNKVRYAQTVNSRSKVTYKTPSKHIQAPKSTQITTDTYTPMNFFYLCSCTIQPPIQGIVLKVQNKAPQTSPETWSSVL